LVKRFFQTGNFEGEVKKDFYGNPIVSVKKIGKLTVPTEEEIRSNGRARSAKLRVAEKI
jgi:16S rRNA (cytosine1402-N4)-methyltransferase